MQSTEWLAQQLLYMKKNLNLDLKWNNLWTTIPRLTSLNFAAGVFWKFDYGFCNLGSLTDYLKRGFICPNLSIADSVYVFTPFNPFSLQIEEETGPKYQCLRVKFTRLNQKSRPLKSPAGSVCLFFFKGADFTRRFSEIANSILYLVTRRTQCG